MKEFRIDMSNLLSEKKEMYRPTISQQFCILQCQYQSANILLYYSITNVHWIDYIEIHVNLSQ